MSSRAAIWGNASKCLSVGERSDGGMQCPARRRWRLLPQGRKKPITWTSKAAAPSEGTRSWVGRDEEPTAEGDGAGSERKKPRGGRLDGPGRLFGRPEASNRTARAV